MCMTKYGFYSIVQKQQGEYHVRSRERKDIENLITRLPLAQFQIIDSELVTMLFGSSLEKRMLRPS